MQSDVAIALLSVTVLGIQAFVLDYLIIAQSWRLGAAFPVADSLLIIYMIFPYHAGYAGVKGGIQWLLYSYLHLIKLVLFHLFLFNNAAATEEVHYDLSGVYVILFLTPIIYVIISFRSADQLYGSTRGGIITIEKMLHVDMVLHVMLDLLDISTAFKYLDLPTAVHTQDPWIRPYVSAFLALALFMHAYSFPTSSIAGKATASKSHKSRYDFSHKGDIFLTRKHAALVAMFLVDLPLLVLRLYLWIMYPQNPGFTPFIIKNMMFLPLQAFRLYQCRLAEKESSKQTQSYILPDRLTEAADRALYLKPSLLNKTSHEKINFCPARSMTGQFSAFAPLDCDPALQKDPPTPYSAKHSLQPNNPRPAIVSAMSSSFSPLQDDLGTQDMGISDGMSYANETHKRYKFPNDEDSQFDIQTVSQLDQSPLVDGLKLRSEARNDKLPLHDGCDESPEVSWAKIERVIRDLKKPRRLPVKGFRFTRLLSKIFSCLNFDNRSGLACLLDENFILGYWKQLRIACPLILSMTSLIILVGICHNFPGGDKPYSLENFTTWNALPTDYKTLIYIIAANGILTFLIWVGTAPVLDVVFVVLLWTGRIVSFFLVVTTVRDTKFIQLPDILSSTESIEETMLLGFMVIPVIRLLDALFAIQSALLGRQFIHFSVPLQDDKYKNVVTNTISHLKHSKIQPNPVQNFDKVDYITTSSLIVFLNCRYSLAPISYAELLIGPNIVKDVRLMDMLVLRSWLEILMQLMVVSISLMSFYSHVNLGIHCSVLAMQCIYNMGAQACRLLALRQNEIKVMFEEIVHLWKAEQANVYAGGDPYHENMDRVDSHFTRKCQQMIAFLNAKDASQRQGFFTSPGNIFPNFI